MGDCMNNGDIYDLAQRDLENTFARITERVNENNNINKITEAIFEYNELGVKTVNYEKYKSAYDEKQREIEKLHDEMSTMRSFLEKHPNTRKVQHETIDIDNILGALTMALERIYKNQLANSENYNISDLNHFEIFNNPQNYNE